MHVGRQPNSGFRLDRIIFHPLPLIVYPPIANPCSITITTNVQLFLPSLSSHHATTASKLFHELARHPPHFGPPLSPPPYPSSPASLCGQKRKVEKTLSRDVPSGAFADLPPSLPPTPSAGARPPFNKPSCFLPPYPLQQPPLGRPRPSNVRILILVSYRGASVTIPLQNDLAYLRHFLRIVPDGWSHDDINGSTTPCTFRRKTLQQAPSSTDAK
ncbi:uncharacterized protein NPIL_61011 [Nephila pilipes]|uniref:Uncharacterized protein n=1 Tax=Nephila pilipes TaxID=299642 RepID=A0A8X6NR17_NEPPI|nr:uncharacterized protein NPIL_61011 [Nephila pilipes]